MFKSYLLSSLLTPILLLLLTSLIGVNLSVIKALGEDSKSKAKQEQSSGPITSFFPEGTAEHIQEVQVKFETEMVPFGTATHGPDPFQINCTTANEKHPRLKINTDFTTKWNDPKTWVVSFKKELENGVNCDFEPSPEFKDLKAQNLKEKIGLKKYSFNTGGPQIIESWPYSDIKEEQYFVLEISCDFNLTSALKHTFFMVEGLSDPISVQEVKSSDQKTLKKELSSLRQKSPKRLLFIKPTRNFPGGSRVKLIWDKNILSQSKSGPALKTTQSYEREYQVRKNFNAELHCARDNANSACNPLMYITLNFSAPIKHELAKKIKLLLKVDEKNSDKDKTKDRTKVFSADLASDSHELEAVTFKGPFPEQATLVLELPPHLVDLDGRSLINASSFPLTIKTSNYSPLLKFSAPFGILESKIKGGAVLPLTIRRVENNLPLKELKISPAKGSIFNLFKGGTRGISNKLSDELAEKMIFWMRAAINKENNYQHTFWSKDGKTSYQVDYRQYSLMSKVDPHFTIKKVTLSSPAKTSFEVIGVPLPDPGFYLVEFESDILGRDLIKDQKKMYVSTSALVTNLAVHVKKSNFDSNSDANRKAASSNSNTHRNAANKSLIWVTSLDSGSPVPGANVSIRDCNGKRLWSGTTGKEGWVLVENYPHNKVRCARKQSNKYGDESGDIGDPLASNTSTAANTNKKNTKKASETESENIYEYYDPYTEGEFIFAEYQGDISFTHTSWEKGIENWRFNLNSSHFGEKTSDLQIFHSVLDRSLFRRGETVSFKHFTREITSEGLKIPQSYPTNMKIIHSGSDKEFILPLSWNKLNGTATAYWKIPHSVPLGNYQVFLNNVKSGTFAVEDFRVPLTIGFLNSTTSNKEKSFIRANQVPVSIAVQYLSGGGIDKLPVKLRYFLDTANINFPQYSEESIEWANGGIEKMVADYTNEESEGRDESGPSDSSDSSDSNDSNDFNDSSNKKSSIQNEQLLTKEEREIVTKLLGVKNAHNLDLKLDQNGNADAVLTVGSHNDLSLPIFNRIYDLYAELEYADPNGETQTISNNFKIMPASRLIGIRYGWWLVDNKTINVKGRVVDIHGKPISNAEVEITLYKQNYYSHRKRLVGGFYAYKHYQNVRKLELKSNKKTCTTDQHGEYNCPVESPAEGNIYVVVTTQDSNGNRCSANTSVYISHQENQWFEVSDNDRIDLIPEKKEYSPGEIAKLQVKMPFKKATALITLEHSGIIDTYVKEITNSSPVIEIPVKKNYAPNIYISCLLVRGRVENPSATFLVDLAKPAYKLGITEIKVTFKDKELTLNLKPNKEVYKVREKGKINISLPMNEFNSLLKKKNKPEVAIAIVDQGLLELRPNNSWDILSAMYPPRAYAMSTYTDQMQIIGKRHFGQKALPSGGGGGESKTRELFDTLLYFNPSIPLNNRGQAEIEFLVNDSITKFKVMALASAGAEYFGSKSIEISSTQDLMVFAGIPPISRWGDEAAYEYTLKNNTAQAMNLLVHSSIYNTSNTNGTNSTQLLRPPEEWKFTLGPKESKKLEIKLLIPHYSSALRYLLEVKDQDAKGDVKANAGGVLDRIVKNQSVLPLITTEVQQSYLQPLTADKKFELPVRFPSNAIKGEGGIEVKLQEKLISGLTGVHKYMQEYPWGCFEQKFSRAMALNNQELLNKLLNELPSYISANGLLKYYPSCEQCESIFLTTYFVNILTMSIQSKESNQSALKFNPQIFKEIEKGLVNFLNGRVNFPAYFSTQTIDQAKIESLNSLNELYTAYPDLFTNSAASFTKSNLSLLSSVKLVPNNWPISTVISWYNFLLKRPSLPHREQYLKETEKVLRARLSYQGVNVIFNAVKGDNSWYAMDSTDVNALRFLGTILTSPEWKAEIPNLVKGVLARMKRGHWDLTTANAWGEVVLQKFSQLYEADKVSGITKAELNSSTHTFNWKDPTSLSYLFPWSKSHTAITTTATSTSSSSSTSANNNNLKLTVIHEGKGRPWLTINSWASIPTKLPVEAGFSIHKSLIPIQRKHKNHWSVGDIVKVKLAITAKSDIGMVVVYDPIPTGSSHLNSNLNRSQSMVFNASSSSANDENNQETGITGVDADETVSSNNLPLTVLPVYEERPFDSYRGYYDYVEKGIFNSEYLIRLNNAGEFELPNTKVEAMYTPEMYGRLPNEKFKISP